MVAETLLIPAINTNIRWRFDSARIRMEKTSKANLRSCTPEVREKISRTIKRLRKMERIRVMSGMKQETKYPVSLIPPKTVKAAYRLRYRRNYFADTDVADRYTLFYDEHTRRSRREEYFTRKYGLKFRQA